MNLFDLLSGSGNGDAARLGGLLSIPNAVPPGFTPPTAPVSTVAATQPQNVGNAGPTTAQVGLGLFNGLMAPVDFAHKVYTGEQGLYDEAGHIHPEIAQYAAKQAIGRLPIKLGAAPQAVAALYDQLQR